MKHIIFTFFVIFASLSTCKAVLCGVGIILTDNMEKSDFERGIYCEGVCFVEKKTEPYNPVFKIDDSDFYIGCYENDQTSHCDVKVD